MCAIAAQLNFHADCFKTEVQSPQLPALAGKALEVHVRAGMAGMSGHAVLDGTQLDDPRCSVSYTDMSPAAASPSPAAAPRRTPFPSPFSTVPDDAAASPAPQGMPLEEILREGCLHGWAKCSVMSGDVRLISTGSMRHSAGMKPSSSADMLQSVAADSESPASTLQPPETSGMCSAASVPHLQGLPAQPGQACLPHTVSEENLSSLESSAGQRMQYALQRLAL
jgi:hypothetical protein